MASKKNLVEAKPQADARIRTGDPFITRGRREAPVADGGLCRTP